MRWRTSAGILLAIALCVGGCAMERHREQVRNGFFTRGLHRDAFLKEWGQPTRTWSVPGSDPIYRTEPYDGCWQIPVYEVWEYPDHAVCLTFDRVRLAFWETGRTDCQPNPPPPSRPQPAPPYPPRQ